ncbi:MAG: DNA mismatch repair protein MutS [Rhodobiaceae bacterium]|nr:MAG: DNA mismatch repair protein MutS [Rhodobiaceae bacterium]
MKQKPPTGSKAGENKRSRRFEARYGRGCDFDPQRTLTAEEQALWQIVTADTDPQHGPAQNPEKTMEELFQTPDKIVPVKKQTAQFIKPAMVGRPAPITRPTVPPLAPLDNRTSKRLVRGQLTPQARLDLHGMTRHTAEPALLHFITRARTQGHKLVLVITGKGAPGHMLHSREFHADPAGRSVLRDLVPALLGEPQFRIHVTGFQPAHPKHGGGGALYLWLRRQK